MTTALRSDAYAATLRPAQVGGLVGLLAAGTWVITWLLARFDYDGLYGQDAYSYYNQAVTLWQELSGHLAAGTEVTAYRWPIGYHLHLIAGFLVGGPGIDGGRAITLLMTVAVPTLLYLIVGKLWRGSQLYSGIVAGIVAGETLALTGTFMRMGLSLMADVPSIFWGLLGIYCALRAWPPNAEPPERGAGRWAIAAGAALGMAVLVRFGAVLLLVPLLLYLLLRQPKSSRSIDAQPRAMLFWAGLGFGIALLPEALYLLTHAAGSGYSAFLGDWKLQNILGTNLVSTDGTLSPGHPNLWFYLFSPLEDSSDFVSFWCLPAALLGAMTLVRERQWHVVGLLSSWWLVPGLFFSGTPYQAHRFVLAYLPALAILVGIGGAVAVEWAVNSLRGRREPGALAQGLASVLLLLAIGAGVWQDQKGMRDWVATHASWKAEEKQVIELAGRTASGGTGFASQAPRVVSFGVSAALDHYTNWLVQDLYNSDETSIKLFFAGSGPRLLVLPESNLATQWANTPLATRWSWLQANYALTRVGQAGSYTVYSVKDRR